MNTNSQPRKPSAGPSPQKPVVKVGPREGKIVGYDKQGHPLYQHGGLAPNTNTGVPHPDALVGQHVEYQHKGEKKTGRVTASGIHGVTIRHPSGEAHQVFHHQVVGSPKEIPAAPGRGRGRVDAAKYPETFQDHLRQMPKNFNAFVHSEAKLEGDRMLLSGESTGYNIDSYGVGRKGDYSSFLTGDRPTLMYHNYRDNGQHGIDLLAEISKSGLNVPYDVSFQGSAVLWDDDWGDDPHLQFETIQGKKIARSLNYAIAFHPEDGDQAEKLQKLFETYAIAGRPKALPESWSVPDIRGRLDEKVDAYERRYLHIKPVGDQEIMVLKGRKLDGFKQIAEIWLNPELAEFVKGLLLISPDGTDFFKSTTTVKPYMRAGTPVVGYTQERKAGRVVFFSSEAKARKLHEQIVSRFNLKTLSLKGVPRERLLFHLQVLHDALESMDKIVRVGGDDTLRISLSDLTPKGVRIGKGFKALYEPDTDTISIAPTYKRGFAHEFWHYLDDKMGGKTGFLSDQPELKPEMGALLDAIKATASFKRWKHDGDHTYLTTPTEMVARCFEQYVHTRLREKGLTSPVTDSADFQGERQKMYLTPEEMSEVRPTMEALLKGSHLSKALTLRKAYHGNAGKLTHAQIAKMKKWRVLVGMPRVLPGFRAMVRVDLARPRLDKRKALAVAARLIDRTYLRVGNKTSAAEGVHGLSTLLRSHAHLNASGLTLEYVGKKRVDQQHLTADREVLSGLKEMLAIPTTADAPLFVYRDRYGKARALTAKMLRTYFATHGITPKDLRTYHANRLFLKAMQSRKRTPEDVGAALTWVAERLGHTPDVTRRAYLHPTLWNRFKPRSGKRLMLMKAQQAKPLEEELSPILPVDSVRLRERLIGWGVKPGLAEKIARGFGLLKSFAGHSGRPGEVGGSLPRGEQRDVNDVIADEKQRGERSHPIDDAKRQERRANLSLVAKVLLQDAEDEVETILAEQGMEDGSDEWEKVVAIWRESWRERQRGGRARF